MARVNKQARTRQVLELVGLGDKSRIIQHAFELMKIAEDEITDACRRCPEARKRIWNSFKLLDPGELSALSDDVYRHHCREMLARVADGKDTRPGTRAEICAMISKMTLATRLHRDVEILGLRISDSIFPNHGLLDGRSEREDYEGSIAEVEREFCRKLARPERVLPEEIRELPAHFLAGM